MTNSATNNSPGEWVQPERSDADSPDVEWTQTCLWPTECVEATLRLAYLADESHVQWQIEVKDPVTQELLAMRSVPHRHSTSALDAATQALTGLRAAFLAVVDPDPF